MYTYSVLWSFFLGPPSCIFLSFFKTQPRTPIGKYWLSMKNPWRLLSFIVHRRILERAGACCCRCCLYVLIAHWPQWQQRESSRLACKSLLRTHLGNLEGGGCGVFLDVQIGFQSCWLATASSWCQCSTRARSTMTWVCRHRQPSQIEHEWKEHPEALFGDSQGRGHRQSIAPANSPN